ncbi:hypothetical protein R1sor_008973 [Riccia sorocarpa]|uniref:Uncharacterized protein n=1 Tax=Riccia sorocarpa TaxID=122646 RepID=A0ABD3H7A2_9MARC
MPKILHPRLLPGNSPQFVLALQSPLYQATNASTSKFQNVENGSKPATRSRAKFLGFMAGVKRGPSRAPTGPVRGVKANGNNSVQRDLDSAWVNVVISTEAPESAQLHKIPVEVEEVPSELATEVKEEFDVVEPSVRRPVKKRARTEEHVEVVEEPSSGDHEGRSPTTEIHATRTQLPEVHFSDLREVMEKAQDSAEPSGAEECASRSRSDRHVRFLNCVTLVLQESSGFLKKSAESGSFQPSYDELRNFQCNAKRLLDEVDQGIHLFRIREIQALTAEKVKAEKNAAAQRNELVSKIDSLEQESCSIRVERGELMAKIQSLVQDNSLLRTECTKLGMVVDRLSEEKAEAEKKADKELPSSELARCLEKHKAGSKECPLSSCRSRISAVLQCNLTA